VPDNRHDPICRQAPKEVVEETNRQETQLKEARARLEDAKKLADEL